MLQLHYLVKNHNRVKLHSCQSCVVCSTMTLLIFIFPFQHYLYELVIKTLVHHNLFYMLHQFLQYHVLSDSKPLVSLQFSLTQFLKLELSFMYNPLVWKPL